MRDEIVVSWQLKRKVEANFSVVKRCAYNFPQVILNLPLPRGLNGPVFSTPWWLTCPQLFRDISVLEGESYINHLQDYKTKQSYSRFVQKAVNKRIELIDSQTLQTLRREKPVLYDELFRRGVAGEEGTGLKCLHAHFAFSALYADYPLGEKIKELLPGKPEERCGKICEQAVGSS